MDEFVRSACVLLAGMAARGIDIESEEAIQSAIRVVRRVEIACEKPTLHREGAIREDDA